MAKVAKPEWMISYRYAFRNSQEGPWHEYDEVIITDENPEQFAARVKGSDGYQLQRIYSVTPVTSALSRAQREILEP